MTQPASISRCALLSVLTVAAFAMTAVPARAQGPSSHGDPAFEKTIRDTTRDLHAVVRYYPEVVIGGEDEIVNDDGSTSRINWDGFSGLFEAELLDGARFAYGEAEPFLYEVIAAVCPSADVSEIQRYGEVQASGAFVSVYGQCPAADAEAGR